MDQLSELCFRGRDAVKLNQETEIKIRISPQAARMPTFTKNVKVGHPPKL